jgi:hypothetical protein
MSISFCSRQSWYERLFPIQICITDTQHYFVSRKLCFSRLAVSNRTESDLIFTLNGKELNLVFNWKLSLDPRINFAVIKSHKECQKRFKPKGSRSHSLPSSHAQEVNCILCFFLFYISKNRSEKYVKAKSRESEFCNFEISFCIA